MRAEKCAECDLLVCLIDQDLEAVHAEQACLIVDLQRFQSEAL